MIKTLKIAKHLIDQSLFFGNKLRKRPTADCDNEILYLKLLGYNQILIVDDCFMFGEFFKFGYYNFLHSMNNATIL